MHIGIDFDNTLVDYSGVFYAVANELGWLTDNGANALPVGQSKNAVKAFFISRQQEPRWTELQGLVYGKYILQAKPYPGALEVLSQLKQQGHQLSLISHKTRYPFIGEPVDLHQSARNWLQANQLLDSPSAPFAEHSVFFNERKQDKIARIASEQCELFLDDLPEILQHADFPSDCQGVLFAPELTEAATTDAVSSWQQFYSHYVKTKQRG